MKVFLSESHQGTIKIASKFGASLRKGDVVALYGSLGSGKTTFTKGLGIGIGVRKAGYINSPTFVIVREYKGKIPLYHIDLYRLRDLKEAEDIGIDEYIYGKGISVVEWPELIEPILPHDIVSVRIEIRGENRRRITIEDIRN